MQVTRWARSFLEEKQELLASAEIEVDVQEYDEPQGMDPEYSVDLALGGKFVEIRSWNSGMIWIIRHHVKAFEGMDGLPVIESESVSAEAPAKPWVDAQLQSAIIWLRS